MKKIVITCTLVLAAFFSQAQKEESIPEKRTEISFSYGILTNAQLIEIIRVFANAFDNYEYDATRLTGGLFVTLRRSSATNKFRYGITAGYDGSKGTYTDPASSSSIPGTYTASHVTVAAEGTLAYMNKPNVRLYGFIGAGYTSITYKRTRNSSSGAVTENSGMFNFQATPIGVSFGNRFGGYLELGVGYKGVVNIGLFARL